MLTDPHRFSFRPGIGLLAAGIVLAMAAVPLTASAQDSAAKKPKQAPAATTSASQPPGAGQDADQAAPSTRPTLAQVPDSRDFMRPTRFGLSVGGGIGMIRTGSPYTLRRGEFATGMNVMNFDRNPGDIDVVEGMFSFGVGITDRFEVFVRYSPVLRTNSVGQDPLNWPIPPVDVFIDTHPTPAARQDPFFLLSQEFPYKTYPYYATNIDPPGNGAFSSSAGDTLLGLKVNLASEDRGDWGGFGIRPYVELSNETPGFNNIDTYKYRAGSAGKTDIGIDFLFSKRVGKDGEILFNLGYKHIGDPYRGMRVQHINSAATTPEEFLVGEATEISLDLRDEATMHFGITFPMFTFPRDKGDLWFLGEFSYLRHIGHGTPTERLVHPAEFRLGVQYNLPFARSVSFGFAWQLLLNDAGDGDLRTTNLVTPDGRGDINFSELVDPALWEEVQRYFLDSGATFSEDAAAVFITDSAAFDAWRNISPEPQTIVGQGGGAALFYVTWRIAQLW